MLKIWVDDIRCTSDYDYVRYLSTNKVIERIKKCPKGEAIYLDLDHDAGDFFYDGGDYIKILDWLEQYVKEVKLDITVHIHSMNPVGRQNMLRICQKNGWKVVW